MQTHTLSIFKSLVMGVLVCAAYVAPTAVRAYDDYYTPVDDYYTPADDYYTPVYDDYYTPVTNDYYTPTYAYTPAYAYDTYGYSGYGYSGYGYDSSYYTPGHSYDYTPYTYDDATYTPTPYTYNTPTYVYPDVSKTVNTCSGNNNCNTTYNPPAVTQTPVSVVVDNDNTNTNNNTNNNNNVITINNPAPVVTVIKERERERDYPEYRQPAYYQPPMYNYNSTPYVSLSAVPYTGLELGFWGSVVYWSVLVLWCLFAAYMIAIKRAHVTLARWFKTFLFGGAVSTSVATHAAAPVREVVRAPAPQSLDKTDDFVMSQILRRA